MYKNVLARSQTCVTCLEIFKTDPTHEKRKRCYGFADPEINESLIGIPLYCNDCRPPGTVNLIDSLCATPFCLTYVRKRGDICGFHKNENSQTRKKERAVGNVLDSIPGNWINNKEMDDKGCGRYRPDFRLDMDDRVVIVECNEYAHQSYPASCENKRTLDIHGATNGKAVIIVAFNPDSKTAGGTSIGSSYPGSKKRHQKLLEIVRQALAFPVIPGMLHVWYMYHGSYIPIVDTYRPVEANLNLMDGSQHLRRFSMSVDCGVTDAHGHFHPLVREF